MYSNNRQDQQDNSQTDLPSWTKFPLTTLSHSSFDFNIIPKSSILVGHHLIIIGHGICSRMTKGRLVVADLRDNSIQEAEIERSSFLYDDTYSVHHYEKNTGEHEIWMFGRRGPNRLVRIIIKDFKPFSFKYEDMFEYKEIKTKGPPFIPHTAQICKDSLYVYRGMDPKDFLHGDLWRFNLREHTWEGLTTTGEIPYKSMKTIEIKKFGKRNDIESWIIDDSLYVRYNAKNIFVLNLVSREWKQLRWLKNHRIKAPPLSKLDEFEGGVVYQRQLITEKKNIISCWNIDTNSLSTFDTQKTGARRRGNLFVYKNFLAAFGYEKDFEDDFFELSISYFNLSSLNLVTTKSLEEKRTMSLFLSHKESNIAFAVEEKILPAHKEILIQKSEYFKNLFNSGMAESRQEVIKITDCKVNVFQEFLRFIYCNEVKLDTDLAFKLIIFADKYLKYDLKERCEDFLKENMNLENVFPILDFARTQDISQLQIWCSNFCLAKADIHNVAGLIKYLDQQNSQDFEQHDILIDKVLDILLDSNYVKFCHKEKQNMQFYEDFLIKNITQDSIERVAKFMSDKRYMDFILRHGYNKIPTEEDYELMFQVREKYPEKLVEEYRVIFEQAISNLKYAASRFIEKTKKENPDWQINRILPKEFFIDYSTEKLNRRDNDSSRIKFGIEESKQDLLDNSKISEEQELGDSKKVKVILIDNRFSREDGKDQNEAMNQTTRSRKRKEPVKDESLEVNPVLKQAKKTPLSKEN